MEAVEPVAYTPPVLSPGELRLHNALAGRDAGFGLAVGGRSWRVEPRPGAADCGLPAVLGVRVGATLWRICLAATQDLYEALDIPDDIDRGSLPEAVLWGIAEARLENVLRALEALTGESAQFTSPDESPGTPCGCLEFSLASPEGGAIRGWAHVPLDARTLEALERVLAKRPRLSHGLGVVPLEFCLEAGGMSLALSKLRRLEPGDVLLPEAWHPSAGFVYLSAPPLRVRVPWPDTGSGMWSIVKESESSMSEAKNEATAAAQAPDAAQAKEASPLQGIKGGLGGIEVDVVFEIGRLRLNVEDLETLGEGRTLPLPQSLGPHVPVTILGNGRKLGTGRIVNVGETLGVQVTALEGRE
ncbi:type III secretion system cytoplasmic ring protein SctQ [Desulfocurvus sp. DL9XJH121]